ncbi:MAG: cytidylate kinase family protein [Candidatus Curtissbacteria bacterium]|nr:cytidylate kinase family protein [Candidatus Curtissbacteria bacterium]
MYTSIVISGPIASGTSTTAKALAEKLHLEYHSAGKIFRKYMLEHNLPLHDKASFPDQLDKGLDEKTINLVKNGGVVVDAHYAGYFTREMADALKVLLTCDYQERIKRALSRVHTHTETEEDIKKREEGLDAKFRKLYADENFLDPKFFDLTINTTQTPSEEVVESISQKFYKNN